MMIKQHSVELDASTYSAAKQMAEREHMTVEALLESLVRYHADYVGTFDPIEEGNGFSLADWEMHRDAGESEEHYQARLDLFR